MVGPNNNGDDTLPQREYAVTSPHDTPPGERLILKDDGGSPMIGRPVPNPPVNKGAPTVRSAPLHPSTFDYLKPNDEQLRTLTQARHATKDYAAFLGALLPDGADKTYVLRKVREIGMWVNVAITRHADGSPRE